jgi:hypothetical protein
VAAFVRAGHEASPRAAYDVSIPRFKLHPRRLMDLQRRRLQASRGTLERICKLQRGVSFLLLYTYMEGP